MLYGRDAERETIGALLRGARNGHSGVLVVRGEAGIGKTALLDDTRERASDMHVLAAHPVESESELAFAALHQLLRPAMSQLDAVPTPQAAALRVALGLEDGPPPEPFLVFAACLTLLSELADRRPVVCIVDDAQWLDSTSAEALLFVARRLDAEGIVMLFGAREGDVRRFDAPGLPSLVLEGLDTEAASAVLARRIRVDAPPAVVDRLVEQAEGNALALLELPGALRETQLTGAEPLPELLPLTRELERIFLDRVRRLPEHAQRLLVVAAADDSEDLGAVSAAAAQLGIAQDALDTVERSGLLSVHGTRIDFRHPLVRSAVYGAATSSDRRSAHRALAAVAGEHEADADRRAWHLAASVVDPDADVVRALADAADRAERRAGFIAAARARERAADLAADDAERGRMLVGAARAASVAGADEDAVRLATLASPLVDDPSQRAEIARALALERIRRRRPLDAAPLLIDAARRIASAEAAKALDLLLDATMAATDGGDFAVQAEISAVAETVQPEDDANSVFVADLQTGLGRLAAGDTERALPHFERVLAAGATSENARHCLWASATAMWLADDRRALELVKRASSLARAEGAIGTLVYALGTEALSHVMNQRFDEAALVGREAEGFAQTVGAANPLALFRSLVAFTAAIRGEEEEVRRNADAALEHANVQGHRPSIMYATWAHAMLDIGQARWADADARLTALFRSPRSFTDSLTLQIVPDHVEVATRAGRTDDATRLLESFEATVSENRAPWARPRVSSCRALLAGGSAATELYDEALQLADEARPFDLARIQLMYGEHLRRERRRADARVQLRAALAGFERFRAAPWIERATAELRATGETARQRDPSTFDQLTPKEIQIARLVADGMSNKEVAAQLFLSPRTIDYHLRNVFAKLGLTSRTQLARVSLGTEVPADPELVPSGA